jgi:hypothetical protein
MEIGGNSTAGVRVEEVQTRGFDGEGNPAAGPDPGAGIDAGHAVGALAARMPASADSSAAAVPAGVASMEK